MMFNRIAKTYDFLNHFLSLGIDMVWRKKAIAELKENHPKMILDVATGTGDLAFEALKLNPGKVIGVDLSVSMLEIAKKKIKKRGVEDRFEVQEGDSEQLAFEDNTFDALTVGFGVRNFEHLEKGLADMYRVLKPGGKAVILEFSRPRVFPVRQLYSFYFFYVLPLLGKLFSKDSSAYTYLPESVAAFPDGPDFLDKLQQAGFLQVQWKPLGFGICSIYTGVK